VNASSFLFTFDLNDRLPNPTNANNRRGNKGKKKMANQCSFVKKSNNGRCMANTINNSEYCFFHDPTMAQRRAEARKTGGYNRRISKITQHNYHPIKSINDVNVIMESTINEALALEPSQSQMKLLGYLCQIALKGQELGSLEDRITSIEKRIEELRKN